MPIELANRLAVDEISLFIDADGTILDLASRPEEAEAPPSLLGVLDSLYRAIDGALAIVSGRRIEDLDRLFAPLVLPASGVHGVQFRAAPGATIVERGGDAVPAALAAAVRAAVGRHPGAFVEDKGSAIAVHWRAAKDREAGIWADLTAALAAAEEPELTIMRGHCVFEIKSAATTKGDAVRAFMQIEPYAGRKPVFVGDDVTDLAGFDAAKSLGGHAFAVGRPMEGADGMFDGPSHVRAWLAALADRSAEARRA